MAKKKKYNPANHNLVPEHKKLSKKEVEKLVEEYGELKNFPRILKTDPAIKSMGLEPGDVVEIVRDSDLDKDLYYRVVVDV